MKTYIFQINYEHYRTGKVCESKIGIVKASSKDEAEKKIWDIYGTDNASMSDVIDITNKETISFSIFANEFN